MSKNPFSEPDDEPAENERTVIRPMPGGRRAATPAQRPAAAATPPPPAPIPAASEAEAPAATGSPLAAAAAPLLQLLARLRNAARQPDPTDLYERTTRALRGFEQHARAAGVPAEHLRPASYALCASLDDAVLNTPWGGASVWAKRPLAAAFHPDITGEGRFFDALARMRQDPARFMPVIEIMYLCLSLGFMGRYRQSPHGAGELDRLRAATGALIADQGKAAPAELSQRWQGIAAPYRPARGGLPIWVVYAAALALCGGLFLWVSTALNAASDAQYARMLAAPPARMPQITRAVVVQPPPPPPAPPEPDTLDRLRSALRPDIEAGALSIVGTPTTPIIRVGTSGGFSATGAVPTPALAGVLGRIGAALSTEPGRVQVIAYTDNQPIRTVQFPSNFQLSAARAQAARAAIARTIGEAKRLGAEGRADADPIAANATAEGRAQNRRLEIVLHRQE
jgi:type VI secretion system protein ImpK